MSFLGARTLRLLVASASDDWRALVSLLRLRLPLAVAAVAGPLAKNSSVSKNGTPMVRMARTKNTINRSDRLAGAIVYREPRQPRRAVVAMQWRCFCAWTKMRGLRFFGVSARKT